MSTELLAAVSDLTAVVEEKVVANTNEVRRAVAEVLSVKALLQRGAATESTAEREYHVAWQYGMQTKDWRPLQRVRSEHKDLYATSGSGAYGIPKTVDDAILFFARTLNPWLENLEVVGPDYKRITNDASGEAWSAAETDQRPLTGTGVWREVAPNFGEYSGYFQASEHARDDIPNLEAQFVADVGRQIGAQLAADILTGGGLAEGYGEVLGLLATAPEATGDHEGVGSPEVFRAYPVLQYVGTSSSPLTVIRFADVENLLSAFDDDYLADPSFFITMRRATWNAMLRAEAPNEAPLLMPRQPSLFGLPVKFCGAMDAVAGGAYPVAAGAWARAIALVTRDPQLLVTVDENFVSPGMIRWFCRRRFGSAVADFRAAKFLKCA